MDIALIVISSILLIVGLIGCILPVLPGPPLSYIGLIVFQFTSYSPFSLATLIIFALLTLVVSVADYLLPIWGNKFTGGTKNGNIGAMIGLLVGIFVFPLVGIILGPFIGAIIGELIGGKKFEEALKASMGALFGILSGTFIKLALSIAMIVIYLFKIANIFL